MEKKRLTQRFPFLLPLRVRQRKACFYLRMMLDGQRYAKQRRKAPLDHLLFTSSCPMYNGSTGFPMEYQKNKVFNLKLAAASIDGLCIRPGETFSFWKAARRADKKEPYREGLTVIDGKLTTSPGGGLCMLTNLLFWVLLHSPLTVVERHGHDVQDFPEPESDAPLGVDATIAEGWLDLKVKNETDAVFQLRVSFSRSHITGQLYCDRELEETYQVVNRDLRYERRGEEVFERVDVVRRLMPKSGGPVRETVLYQNQCRIGYPLPEGTVIKESFS